MQCLMDRPEARVTLLPAEVFAQKAGAQVDVTISPDFAMEPHVGFGDDT